MRCTIFNSIGRDVAEFLQDLESRVELYIVGGALRDCLDNRPFNDLDIVFVGDYTPKRAEINCFGGYRIPFKDTYVDLWKLGNTFGFRKGIPYTGPEDFLKTPFLNIDSIMYDWQTEEFVGNSDILYKNIKELDVVACFPEVVELNKLRAFRYIKKYNLGMSDKLKVIFQKKCDILKLQEEHYGDNYLIKSDVELIENLFLN